MCARSAANGRRRAARELAKRLGVDSQKPEEDQTEDARQWLGARRSLLVLDDVWDAELLKLHPGGNCSVLATSRRQLEGLRAGQMMRLGGLSQAEARQLFAERLPDWMEQHEAGLMGFAKEAEYLALALSVAAGALRNPKKRLPKAQAIAQLREAMKGGKLDQLFERALERHSAEARRLLGAVAHCSEQGGVA